jgi:hypothetical protein
MSVDAALLKIEETLKPKSPSAEAQEPKPRSHVDLADALLALPEISKALETLVAERKRENNITDIITGFDLTMQRVAEQSETNLQKIDAATSLLQKRIDQFNKTEAQYQHLIERVSDVLDELERVLKKM